MNHPAFEALRAVSARIRQTAKDRRDLAVYQERLAENQAPMALRAAAQDAEHWADELDAALDALSSPPDGWQPTFMHWSKDHLVPYDGCPCATCKSALPSPPQPPRDER